MSLKSHLITFYFIFSVMSKCQYFLQHPKTKRYRLLISFFTFSVLLVSADIISDIVTALDFHSRGDINWAIFTLIPVVAPFIARIVLSVVNYFLAKKSFFFNEELSELFWHFPLFHPIRYIEKLLMRYEQYV